jgi:hypothetical protein
MSIKAIDEAVTEDGFAKRNPQLLATFMQTALLDFHATRFGELLESIDCGIHLFAQEGNTEK